MTAQRSLIYRALEGDATHPTAEELYERLRPQLPHLSLTTVYKTLNELVAWGELRRIDTGDGRIHFDPDVREHSEIVCLRCHRVEDVPDQAPRAAMHGGATHGGATPGELAGYRIVRRAETFYGYCPQCRTREQ